MQLNSALLCVYLALNVLQPDLSWYYRGCEVEDKVRIERLRSNWAKVQSGGGWGGVLDIGIFQTYTLLLLLQFAHNGGLKPCIDWNLFIYLLKVLNISNHLNTKTFHIGSLCHFDNGVCTPMVYWGLAVTPSNIAQPLLYLHLDMLWQHWPPCLTPTMHSTVLHQHQPDIIILSY